MSPASDRNHFHVDVTYTTKQSGTTGTKDGEDNNPSNVSISFGSKSIEWYQPFDINGKAFINSAGDVYDPVPSIPLDLVTININRRENTFDPDNITEFKNTVNENAIVIAGVDIIQGYGRLTEYNATRKVDSEGIFYYDVSYQVTVADPAFMPGWEVHLVDQGKFELIDGKSTEIRLAGDKSPVTRDIPLNGKGRVLPEADRDQLEINEFEVFLEANWANLNLPRS